MNTLDDPELGPGGMYLTVLGTSAEGADGGEVGRGNRVNGLISFNRPMTMEAAAGKNPVSHVGKIYNLLSHQLARKIHAQVEGVEEVYVWFESEREFFDVPRKFWTQSPHVSRPCCRLRCTKTSSPHETRYSKCVDFMTTP